MSDKKILDKTIKCVLKVIVPDTIILFGSQARGNARPDSDYDILVIKSGISKKEERPITHKIYRSLIDSDACVDVIVKSPESIETSRKLFVSVVKEALKEGIVIYGKSRYLAEKS